MTKIVIGALMIAASIGWFLARRTVYDAWVKASPIEGGSERESRFRRQAGFGGMFVLAFGGVLLILQGAFAT